MLVAQESVLQESAVPVEPCEKSAGNLVEALNDCQSGRGGTVARRGCPFLYTKPVRHAAGCPTACGAATLGALEDDDCDFSYLVPIGPQCTSCQALPEIDECGLCPCCQRCEAHIDLYGHDPQYFCDRLEPKIRLLRPFEIYPGTFGRQAYARAYGYDCHTKRYRSHKPAAYIAHEYVAAINRAVWEQLDAQRAHWAFEAAAADLADKQLVKDIAATKVFEWRDYLEAMCRQGDSCQMSLAGEWLNVSLEADRKAACDLDAAAFLYRERQEYSEFATKRAKNSEKDARIASHHQRVFVKPPLDREALRAGLPDLTALKKSYAEANAEGSENGNGAVSP